MSKIITTLYHMRSVLHVCCVSDALWDFPMQTRLSTLVGDLSATHPDHAGGSVQTHKF